MQAHLHTPLTTKTTYTKALEMGRRDYAPHWAEAPCAGAQCPAKLAHVPGSQAHTCVLYTRAAYRRRQPCLLKQTRGQQARLAPTLQEPQRRSASARSATRARSAAARGSRAPGRGPRPTRAAAQARTRPPASLRHARDRVRTSVTAAVALRPWPASGGSGVLRAARARGSPYMQCPTCAWSPWHDRQQVTQHEQAAGRVRTSHLCGHATAGVRHSGRTLDGEDQRQPAPKEVDRVRRIRWAGVRHDQCACAAGRAAVGPASEPQKMLELHVGATAFALSLL